MLKRSILVCLLSAMAFAQQGSLLPMPKLQFFDNSGAVCSGCKVYSYSAGTTTPRNTYTDAGLGTPNSNPVILDSAGRANIWLSDNVYKIVLTTADGVQLWSVDNVAGTNGGVALSLDSPPPIGDVTPNTGNFTTLTSKVSNGVAYVAEYAGSDLGAKITACFTASQSVCVADTVAGQTLSSAVTVPAGATLRFLPGTTNPTVYTLSASITLLADAVLEKEGNCGTIQCSVELKQANGANLPYLVHMTGDRSVIRGLWLEGNYANNSSALDVVLVDNGNRVGLYNVQVSGGKRNGVRVQGASSCCGRIDNDSMLIANNASNLYLDGTGGSAAASDWIINTTEFENSATRYGIEAVNAPTPRITNFDVGGNFLGGILVTATGTSVATGWQLDTGQFGGNGGADFTGDGSGASDQYRCGSNVLTNIRFIGLKSGTTNNTYDTLHFQDCGGNTIAANFFGGAAPQAYRYHYYAAQTLGSVASSFTGNTFNSGGAATADISALSVDTVIGNANPGGGIPSQNFVLKKYVPLLMEDNLGAYFGALVADGTGKPIIKGNSNASVSGKYQIALDPNNSGSPIATVTGSGTGSGGGFVNANNNYIKWLDHTGALCGNQLLVDSSDNFFIGGCTNDRIYLQPKAGTNYATLVDGSPADFLTGLNINSAAFVDSSRNVTAATVKIGGTYYAPVVEASSAGHASCIKAVGPPVQIGYCSTVVDASGNCTCN